MKEKRKKSLEPVYNTSTLDNSIIWSKKSLLEVNKHTQSKPSFTCVLFSNSHICSDFWWFQYEMVLHHRAVGLPSSS